MLAQETRPLSPSDPEWVKKFPQPKFKLGQEVEYSLVEDNFDEDPDGLRFVKRGIIFGYWFAEIELPNHTFNMGWRYQVYLEYDEVEGGDLKGSISPHSAMRIEEVPEGELNGYD